MPYCNANGIKLYYERQGVGDPIVLVMGISAQLIYWPDGFCDKLAARGFSVIRFDNRDVGLSTWLEELGTPRLSRLLAGFLLRRPVVAPYLVRDMARDVVGLLDALALPRAHLVGMSMGGMVAQQVAIEFPARVATLTSMCSTPGSRRHSLGRPGVMLTSLKPRPLAREAAIRAETAFLQAIMSPAYPTPRPVLEQLATRAYERGYNPPGIQRQFAAILASGSRRHLLAQLRTPTLVLHGTADPLVPPRAGAATAAAIPGARLQWIDGWGHDLPAQLWPTLTEAIGAHAAAPGA